MEPTGPEGTRSWPIEILELFITHLGRQQSLPEGESSKLALCKCLLVDKNFYHLARRELFKHLILHFTPYNEEGPAAEKLHAIISKSTSLLSVTRTLSLLINPTSYECHGEVAQAPNTMTYSHPKFAAVLHMIAAAASLQNLIIRGAGATLQRCDFSELHEPILLSLVSLRCLPSLRTLYIHSTKNFPRSLITGPKNDKLRELTLHNVDADYSQPSLSQPPFLKPVCEPYPELHCVPDALEIAARSAAPPLATLRHLDIFRPQMFVRFLLTFGRPANVALSTYKFPLLTSLRIHLPYWSNIDALTAFKDFIVVVGPTLKELSLHLYGDLERTSFKLDEQINLPHLPLLEKLYISTSTYPHPPEYHNAMIKILTQILRSSGHHQSALRTLEIRAEWAVRSLKVVDYILAPKNVWEELDTVLSDPTQCSHSLMDIEVALAFKFPHSVDLRSSLARREEVRENHYKTVLFPRMVEHTWIDLKVGVALQSS